MNDRCTPAQPPFFMTIITGEPTKINESYTAVPSLSFLASEPSRRIFALRKHWHANWCEDPSTSGLPCAQDDRPSVRWTFHDKNHFNYRYPNIKARSEASERVKFYPLLFFRYKIINPFSSSSGSTIISCLQWGAMTADRPPVMTTVHFLPSCCSMRSIMPSTPAALW